MMPHVTCVCLTADRQAMTGRAVKCFLAQTYPNKSLLIWDSGKTPWNDGGHMADQLIWVAAAEYRGRTIGALRNLANDFAFNLETEGETDIIAHWDSDDYSHPLRLAWQVAELRNSERRSVLANHEPLEAVGYRSMLFWDSRAAHFEELEQKRFDKAGQAWLYEHDNLPSAYILGTSLMYWRKTWEKKPFPERCRPGVPPEKDFAEDHEWIKGLKVASEAGFFHDEPAMVAEIHGGNLTAHDYEMPRSTNWKRVPEWDARLKEIMKL